MTASTSINRPEAAPSRRGMMLLVVLSLLSLFLMLGTLMLVNTSRAKTSAQAFAAATAPARKYVLLVTNTQDVVIFNLEDKIRDDLLNLNVNEKP